MADKVSQLLTEIQNASDFTYMSDLRGKNNHFNTKVKNTINKISDDFYSLETWNSAASYIMDQDIQFQTIQQVKELLINFK